MATMKYPFFYYQTFMKKFIVILSFIIITNSLQSIFAYDYSNKKQWKVVESSKVDTSIPSWFKPMETDNLNDWLDILPDNLQKYRSEEQFMVIPAMWLITPVVELETSNPDYKIATKWWEFDYNKYLVHGPTIYPWTAPVWNVWNSFIFAHSNYRINKPGDFKTIFRLTYNIEKWDIIRYYKKENNSRKQYTFTVTKSMLVNETDIRVMLPTKGKKEITLSACRPIGTAKQRRINRAELTSEKILDYTISNTKEKKIVNQAATWTNTQANIATGNWIQNWTWTQVVEYKPKWIDELAKKAYELAIEVAKLLE